MKELNLIQTELNCPKTLKNSFGNYFYRSAEAILEALKPLLKEHQCMITLTDSIELIGDWHYVKATARLINKEGKEIFVTAFAREPEVKKGADPSQITGATSSYARKYALNGLFAIDDTKDADATNDHSVDNSALIKRAVSAINSPTADLDKIMKGCKDKGILDEKEVQEALKAKQTK